MKKTIAILLLAVHLFNLGGYSLVFGYLMQRSETQFVQQLDQHIYKETELVEISIPLHLPYIQNSGEYERIDGTVEDNGIHYNFVKRRIHNDTLYIMCLPNEQKTQLAKGKSNYAGEVNDFNNSKKEKDSPVKKAGPSAEYNNEIVQYVLTLNDNSFSQKYNSITTPLSNMVLDMPGHPPKLAC
ncbi:MAG: hypothetical protein QM726_08275 [Chitinophagaceae bacterium]